MSGEHRVVALDRCPGLLRPYQSADGALVRLRVPGGRIPASTLRALSTLAVAYGDGSIQITSRGNLQLRGLRLVDGVVDPALEQAIVGLGLLPHPSHELVRNIVASPLSGIDGGLIDPMPLVRVLDDQMCADPALARLPGRFLWAVDDGRHDTLALEPDLTLLPRGAGEAVVVVAGGWVTPPGTFDESVTRMLTLAAAFVEARERLRPEPWRIAELALPGAELSDELRPCDRLSGGPVPTGRVANGAATVLMPRLGLIAAAQADALAAQYGDRLIVVTPWRQIVVPGDAAALTGLGLESDPDSSWARITACPGAPGCANGAFDTAREAGAVAAAMAAGRYADDLPVHIVACERHCGTPTGRHYLIERPESMAPPGLAEPASIERSATIEPTVLIEQPEASGTA